MSARHLVLSGIAKSFDGPSGRQRVVDGFDLEVEARELVALIGHSGCGKSTVLSMVAGLTKPDVGSIVLGGRAVKDPGPDRGMVFQSACLLPWMTALQNVLLAVEQVMPSATRAQQRASAMHYLELVGLDDAAARKPAELSMGMRQRVGLARAFACRPDVLLLDEPFGMLDSITRMELQDVLLSLWSEHRITALMVTHDVDEALLLSDRVVMMTSGPHAHVGEILEVALERPRNRRMLVEDARFDAMRERVIGFLEERAGHHAAPTDEERDELESLSLAEPSSKAEATISGSAP
ncbi:ABC transporter ATP-binding protein [Sandaracinus amylolyticus]|uniref:Nitrate ABC transporter, ATP-binding protein n=1 Tax=Sandaracinus amylolyticus TaxID=927083 RepID=A0A0F6YFR0_9BACT|nr:ABC transporter ATP-binding protein [Sandaracinus amylolyticus]AKF03891.1 Nitrate ABC transporter, ATP-binding protein [Sandaracinus amylolyticus]